MIFANPLAVFSSLLALAGSVCGGETGAAVIGPVYPKNFADPYVMLVGDTFYAYSTNARGKNTPVIRSRCLIEWEEMGDALPKRPKWSAEVNFLNWAPGVMQVGDRFVLYHETGRRADPAVERHDAGAGRRVFFPRSKGRSLDRLPRLDGTEGRLSKWWGAIAPSCAGDFRRGTVALPAMEWQK